MTRHTLFDSAFLNRLFRYCLALCGERHDAYDLLQDAIEKYLRHDTDNANTPVKTPYEFIQRTARNRFFDLQKRRQIVQFDVLEDTDLLNETEKDLETLMVDKLTLKSIWKSLTAAEREVVFLWAAEGLTAAEIAGQLQIPRATVLSRLRRLRQRVEQSSHNINENYSKGGSDNG